MNTNTNMFNKRIAKAVLKVNTALDELSKAANLGDFNSNDGCGNPVHIDYWEDRLRVMVWSDINEEDPTHIIPLDGASESLRKEQE